MFTVSRLGIDGRLATTPVTSNPVESMISIARTTNRNVTRWRDGHKVLRPAAAGMLNAERSSRRIKGYQQMPQLIEARQRHAHPETASSTETVGAAARIQTGSPPKFHGTRDSGLGASSPASQLRQTGEPPFSERPHPSVKIRVSQGEPPPPPASAHGEAHSDSTHHPSPVHLLLRPGPRGAPSPGPDTARVASVVTIDLALRAAQDRSRSRGPARRRVPPSWR